VVSDVIMPGMSGLDLCRAIRRDQDLRETPFILLTSLADPLDVVRGLQSGADNYVTKPYDAEQLLSRIQRTLQSWQRARAGLRGGPIEIRFLGGRFTTDEVRWALPLYGFASG
jgi:DNA-binding response OmpR family regulator